MHLLIFTLLLISSAFAQDLKVEDVVIKLNPPGSNNAAGLMVIKNDALKDIILLRVHSEIATKTELHQMKKENGLMKMRPIEKVVIKAKSKMALTGEYHVMFIGLKKRLVLKEKHSLVLLFDNGQSITIQGEVK